MPNTAFHEQKGRLQILTRSMMSHTKKQNLCIIHFKYFTHTWRDNKGGSQRFKFHDHDTQNLP